MPNRRQIPKTMGRSFRCGLLFLIAAVSLLMPGCFTLSETERPVLSGFPSADPGKTISVAVRGFKSTITEYAVIGGYQTYYVPGGWYGCWGGYQTTYTSCVVPQSKISDVFLDQARDRMECHGFAVMAQQPDYIVEGRFDGPVVSEGDAFSTVAWLICSIFTCHNSAQTWVGRLKVYDNRTGKLVHSREFVQRYEVTGFSPIPLLGISGYERTTSNYMQCWCLSVLTDEMMADAASFVLSR